MSSVLLQPEKYILKQSEYWKAHQNFALTPNPKEHEIIILQREYFLGFGGRGTESLATTSTWKLGNYVIV